MSLRESAALGIKWSALSLLGRRVMSLLAYIIMARLLDPLDFGLVAMAGLIFQTYRTL